MGTDGRSILLSFGGHDGQMTNFKKFFKNEKGKEEETLTKERWNEWTTGKMNGRHAVVALGYNPQKNAWKIQNSWGGKYRDGYCFVEHGAWPNPKFIDVYAPIYGVLRDK